MAKSGEIDADDANSKMDDLAGSILDLALTMKESLSRDIPFPTGVEHMRSDILQNVGDKFDSQWLGAKIVFEAEQHCKTDAKAKAA